MPVTVTTKIGNITDIVYYDGDYCGNISVSVGNIDFNKCDKPKINTNVVM